MNRQLSPSASQHRSSDDIANLRQELALVQSRLDHLQRHRAGGRFRRIMPLAIVALLVALMPLSILAAGPVFSDLGTAAPVHQPNIQAIGNAGITTGFEDPADPTKRLYNPKDLVTREEMASFLARTAGISSIPPVVNAARLAVNTPVVGGPTYAANELTRIAFSNNTDTSTGTPIGVTGQTVIVSIPLTLTQQSYVRVSFSTLLLATSTVNCPCSVRAYLQQDAGTALPVKRANIGTAAAEIVASFDRRDLTGTLVFVAPAGNHTYKLLLEQVTGTSANLSIIYPNIQAEIYPFGATGAGASGIDEPTVPATPKD